MSAKFVVGGDERPRDGGAECRGGLQVGRQLEIDRTLDREVAWRGALAPGGDVLVLLESRSKLLDHAEVKLGGFAR